MAVDLKPHQEEAIKKLGNGQILWGGVGTGKTITALAYFYTKVCGGTLNDMRTIKTPMDIYVITTAKKRDSLDWESEAAKMGISNMPGASIPGISMTVDSWNNIGRYEGVKDAFFVFDEQRLVGSGAWVKSFIKIARNNQWILLSATPGDTWMDFVPIFIANGLYENRTAFKREHVIYQPFQKFPKIDRYIGVGKLVRNRNKLLVHMPYDRHTTRVEVHKTVDFNHEQFDKVVTRRWHVFEERPLRDVSELFHVARKVVNSDTSRLAAVEYLWKKHPKLIVFYNFDYELEILRGLKNNLTEGSEKCSSYSSTTDSSVSTKSQDVTSWSTGEAESSGSTKTEHSSTFTIAEWNGHKHDPLPTSKRWIYLVQYTAGSEGWNCVTTNAMCFYSLTYSYKQYIQAHGRIDRLNTPYDNLYYYTLISKAWIDQAIMRSLRAKRSFNEASVSIP